MFALQVVFFLIVFGSVVFIAYVATKYIGVKASKSMRGKYIRILESVSIGLDKQLHLVKVADQYILISSSGKNIEFLTTVNMEPVEEETENDNIQGFDFKSIFDKYLSGMKNIQLKKNTDFAKKDDPNLIKEHVFKNNLNRLRNITISNEISKKDTYKTDINGVLDGVDITNDKEKE